MLKRVKREILTKKATQGFREDASKERRILAIPVDSLSTTQLRFDGVEVEGIAVESMSSIPTYIKAWKWLLQAIVGAEQAIHSRACYY